MKLLKFSNPMKRDQGPFSIFYLEAQVTWIFSSKSLDRFLYSLQVTWKPSHLEINPINGLSANARKLLDQPEAR